MCNKCESCEEESEDVSYRENPFVMEVYGESSWSYMCDACYEQSSDDI